MNIFISRPNVISGNFKKAYVGFDPFLKRCGFAPCRLGEKKYTLNAPLTGVIELMEACSGAIVLGYPKYQFNVSVVKGNELQQKILQYMPTPWNHIEATLAFSKSLPILIIAHEGISDGVFDPKVTGKFILTVRLDQVGWFKGKEFKGVFQEWRKKLILNEDNKTGG